jgi:hypothetical protein
MTKAMLFNTESITRTYISLVFFFVWCLYGCVTNLWDQYGYNLMHAGVEALGERSQFHLDGSDTSKFAQIGKSEPGTGKEDYTDVFRYKGNLYAMKHPGMFFLGAFVYKPMSLAGLRYEREYNLTTAIVSWLSSGLLGALVVSLLFSQALGEGLGYHGALIVAFSLGMGSLFFPYSGVLHHDFLASCMLYFAYYLSFGPQERILRRPSRFFYAGLLAGFAFTTSAFSLLFLLPFLIAMSCAKGLKLTVFFLSGYVLGAMPLLFYDTVCFGNPFILPNQAARDLTVIPSITLEGLWEKFQWYFISPRFALWSFCPAFYFAAFGLISRAVKGKADSIILIGGNILLALWALSIPTHGGASFGPRYLLAGLPFLAVGLIPVMKWLEDRRRIMRDTWRYLVWLVLGLSFAAGIVICSSGALRGSMYGMEPHPFLYRLIIGLGLSQSPETPGAFPLLYPIVFIASLVFYFLPKHTVRLVFPERT